MIYDTLGEYGQSGLVCESIDELLQTWLGFYDKDFRLVYQPLNPVQDFAYVCELVFNCEDMTFLVEEVDTFLSLNPTGIAQEFLHIVQRGRHNGIELIGVTQRPYAIPAILRSQAKVIYTFRQFEERDITWLRNAIGEQGIKAKDLKQFNFLRWENGNIDEGITKPV